MPHQANPSSIFLAPMRLLAVTVAVSAALWAPLASAQGDDYAEVNRLMRSGQMTDALGKAEQYLTAKPRDPQTVSYTHLTLPTSDLV